MDTYYGGDNLVRAARLLGQAYQTDPTDANVYVQAARITVLGGALTFGRFQGGTSALYAKAAQLLMEGRPTKEARPFIDEARTFGFSKAAVLEYVVERRGFGNSLKVLAPTLNKIVD